MPGLRGLRACPADFLAAGFDDFTVGPPADTPTNATLRVELFIAETPPALVFKNVCGKFHRFKRVAFNRGPKQASGSTDGMAVPVERTHTF